MEMDNQLFASRQAYLQFFRDKYSNDELLLILIMASYK